MFSKFMRKPQGSAVSTVEKPFIINMYCKATLNQGMNNLVNKWIFRQLLKLLGNWNRNARGFPT